MIDKHKGKASKAIDDSRVNAHTVYDDLKSDTNSRITYPQEIYEDARGFTYQSVLYCDLDRFRDK
jgi:hypothetical protein